jgi:hypothetical protein
MDDSEPTTSTPATNAFPRGLRLATVIAAIAGPVLFAVGHTLFPPLPADFEGAFPEMIAHRDQLFLARMLAATGYFLLVAAPLPILALVPPGIRGRLTLVIGSVLVSVGSFTNGISFVVRAYAEEAATQPSLPAGAGAAVYRLVGEGAGSALIFYWWVPVFALGFVVTAVGVLMSRRVPAVLPLVIIAGVLLAYATNDLGAWRGLTQLPFVAAFAALAVLAARRGYLAPVAATVPPVHAVS